MAKRKSDSDNDDALFPSDIVNLSLSEMKKTRGRDSSYFDGEINDGKTSMRVLTANEYLVFTTICAAKSFAHAPLHSARPAACSAGVQHARIRACAIMQQEISIPKRDIHTYIHTDAKRDAKQD